MTLLETTPLVAWLRDNACFFADEENELEPETVREVYESIMRTDASDNRSWEDICSFCELYNAGVEA